MRTAVPVRRPFFSYRILILPGLLGQNAWEQLTFSREWNILEK